MNLWNKPLMVICVLAMLLPVFGCGEDEGAMEKMGKKMDQTMNDAKKKVDDMTKSINPEEQGAMEKMMGSFGEKMDAVMGNAGEAMDKMVDDAKNAVDKATQ